MNIAKASEIFLRSKCTTQDIIQPMWKTNDFLLWWFCSSRIPEGQKRKAMLCDFGDVDIVRLYLSLQFQNSVYSVSIAT